MSSALIREDRSSATSRIGRGVRIYDQPTGKNPGNLTLYDGAMTARFATLALHGPVRIGKRGGLAPYISIVTSQHELGPEQRSSENAFLRPARIDESALILWRATILLGPRSDEARAWARRPP